MSAFKVISGINQVRTAFRLLDTELQQRLRVGVRESTESIRARAMALVPTSGPRSRKAKGRPGPGELRATIRAEFSAEGFVGYVKAGVGTLKRRSRATRPPKLGPHRLRTTVRLAEREAHRMNNALGQYAMVVEFGSPREGKAAQPYMRPARQAEVPRHAARMQDAITGAVSAAGGDA